VADCKIDVSIFFWELRSIGGEEKNLNVPMGADGGIRNRFKYIK